MRVFELSVSTPDERIFTLLGPMYELQDHADAMHLDTLYAQYFPHRTTDRQLTSEPPASAGSDGSSKLSATHAVAIAIGK